MARIFITGSSDGLGLMAAQLLVEQGHSVVLHARSQQRVPTKMVGSRATDDLDQAHRTQVWLAVSDDPAASVSGEYFYHMERQPPHPAARDINIQDRLLDFCSRVTGVQLPS